MFTLERCYAVDTHRHDNMESQQGGSNLTEGQGDEPEDTDMALVCLSSELDTRSGSIDVEAVEAKLFSWEIQRLRINSIRSLWVFMVSLTPSEVILSVFTQSHSDVEDIVFKVDTKESSCQVG